MHTKLTIRLIGYSLIAIWCVWLLGRPERIEHEGVDQAAVKVSTENLKIGDEEPVPLEEDVSAKAVRLYIDHMLSTDEQIDQLMSYVRQSPDDPAWSAPVRAAITEVIQSTEREMFESGELYAECGGLACFIHGDFDRTTTLSRLPLALWSASNRDGVTFATARSQQSEKYGWVFVVVSPDFEVPENP